MTLSKRLSHCLVAAVWLMQFFILHSELEPRSSHSSPNRPPTRSKMSSKSPQRRSTSAGMRSSVSPSTSKRRRDLEKAAIRSKERRDMLRKHQAIQFEREFSEKKVIWSQQVLPRWSELKDSRYVRDLCFRGIPTNLRGKVWPLLIGNDLEVRTLTHYSPRFYTAMNFDMQQGHAISLIASYWAYLYDRKHNTTHNTPTTHCNL